MTFSNIRARKAELNSVYPAVQNTQTGARSAGTPPHFLVSAKRRESRRKFDPFNAETAAGPEIFKSQLFRIDEKIRRV
ncbi:hypothetical protein [Rhizobium sp. C4]|uniref:hypothetical protein n=1 Tax=Rhizobium sp. C4 TaxID=1349800 RepID=UPI001E3C2D64|nr:hypothetical protein [Rhizobium sp. C4]MCD2172452.1 hypothetical protein [Rhizobium sp. C4]